MGRRGDAELIAIEKCFGGDSIQCVTIAGILVSMSQFFGGIADRGSQYASHDYQAVLKEYGMTPSMSRKGNCWDNAPMESFFNSLKNERTHHQRYATREEARQDTFEYIEVFYNRSRRHSALGYQSPAAFYATWLNKQKLAA